jgi:hypothetical protein
LVQNKKKGDGEGNTRRLVTSGFWHEYDIDVAKVGMVHRTRKHQDGHIVHNGRPFGVLPPLLRKCDLCPSNRPATLCVRQCGTQWLCMEPDPADGAFARCHQGYTTPIDVGYLDMDVPNNHRDDAMVIEEVEGEHKEETTEEQHTVLDVLKRLPVTHTRLLADLGFVPGVYEVTTEQMQAAWEGVDTDNLDSLDETYGCALRRSVSRGHCMKTVRSQMARVMEGCNIRIDAIRKRLQGKEKARLYVLGTFK